MHRGPTHSIITFTVLMIPFFVIYRKQAVPYYAALLSHSLIGDFFTGGIELFWPVSHGWFGFLNIEVGSLTNVVTELTLFAVVTIIMFKAKDLQTLLKPNIHNLALVVAFTAVLGPLLATRQGFESSLPVLLVVPSLFWLVLFGYSILVDLRAKFEKASPTGYSTEHSG